VKRLAALVLCTVALGAACAEKSSAPAATVNGSKIPTSDLVDELNAISANTDYLNGLQSNASAGGATVTGATPGSYDAGFVSQVLLQDIYYSLVHDEFAKRKLGVTDACRLRARNEAMLQIGNGDATKGEALLAKFPTSYQDVLVRRNTELLALETDLAGAQCGNEADTYYANHPDDFTKMCISLIAVPDQATADSVVAQLRAGADFATLVQQVSIDEATKATNGDAGCVLAGRFNTSLVQVLQRANVGDVLDPIPGQSGVSILKLTGRQVASLEEVQAQADELASTAASQAFSQWLSQARSAAQVTIDPRYGTFDPTTFQITPPTSAVDQGSSSPLSSASDSP
jgi:parvulin-like peptidyl-prolyl isomerase